MLLSSSRAYNTMPLLKPFCSLSNCNNSTTRTIATREDSTYNVLDNISKELAPVLYLLNSDSLRFDSNFSCFNVIRNDLLSDSLAITFKIKTIPVYSLLMKISIHRAYSKFTYTCVFPFYFNL